ncbi:Interferon-induced guanylate-binding protein 2 [Cricetulus griseus]|uniref:Interferon-induced guanylate-binding protein 2 n=1 Tax=Cricetulus griseus TaxID=10029 RepID=G3IHK6_CRIGR|nr:Interferon-induced guanylate-binding protein 2 [Cricetulus griseus]
MEHSFKDDEQEFQRKLVVAIEERKQAFMLQNEAASVSYCQAELEKLTEPLKESVSSGVFSVPGGHSLYLEAKKKVEQGYEQVPRKGVKAKEILKSFLKSQATVEKSILQSDKALTDGQRAIAAEQTKKEVAEKERELLRQKQKEQEQVMEAQERSFRENIAKLQEKMERERETLLREQEKMLEHKLKRQKNTLDMASEIHMLDPMCLIENTEDQLVINQQALGILSAIQQPVVVVAIVGLYRTGKSYLMNKLAGKKTGFSLGSTVQSHTKGIWMWCVPHPQKSGHTLVLLDTEGLEDVEKGDNQNDCWIFALAVLLSSTFIYNSIGTINQQAMDQLHYVTELTDLIKSKSSPEQSGVDDSANFVGFFPTFVWALRDFSLELEANGKSITADEYLEHSLTLKKGSDKKSENFNKPRLCIRKFFPKRKCFVFDRPAQRKYLSKLETIREEELSGEFVEQVAEFTSYIFTYSNVKTLSGGIIVNGPRKSSLVLPIWASHLLL